MVINEIINEGIIKHCATCESPDDVFEQIFFEGDYSTSEQYTAEKAINPIKNIDDIESAYQEYLVLATSVKDELGRTLKRAGGSDGKVYLDIKKYKSFSDKIMNRGRDILSINDVLRSTLTLKDNNQVKNAAKKLKKMFNVVEYEFKEFGKTGDFGYHGSHHFTVKMSNGLNAEIQVMTRRMFAFKDRAHDFYTKWRSLLPSVDKWDEKMRAEYEADVRQSQDLFTKANMKPRIPNKAKAV